MATVIKGLASACARVLPARASALTHSAAGPEKFLTKRGLRPGVISSISCSTSTWPEVPTPAPMPITANAGPDGGPASAPAGLTEWDRSYLTALYEHDQLRINRNSQDAARHLRCQGGLPHRLDRRLRSDHGHQGASGQLHAGSIVPVA